MSEELSPESKLYVKEEIEKIRKEVKEEEKVKSKATKTFSTVVIVVGLLTGLGVYGLAVNFIDNAIKKGLGAEALEKIKSQEKEAATSLENILNQETAAKEILSYLKYFDQKASKKGHAWVGSILFQWGTERNSDEPSSYSFDTPYPNECFSVIPNVKKVGGRSAAIHISQWDKDKFSINRDNDIDGWYDINYIAIGH